MAIVAALSTGWGVEDSAYEKEVWALLAITETDPNEPTANQAIRSHD